MLPESLILSSFVPGQLQKKKKEVLSVTHILQIAVVIHRVLSFAVLATYGYGLKLLFCLSAGKGTEKTTADDDQGN